MREYVPTIDVVDSVCPAMFDPKLATAVRLEMEYLGVEFARDWKGNVQAMIGAPSVRLTLTRHVGPEVDVSTQIDVPLTELSSFVRDVQGRGITMG